MANKQKFTSQELFVIMHIAYAESQGMKINNISDMMIYWEPHCVERDEVEHYAEWLNDVKNEGYIVNIVRNSYMRSVTNIQIIEANEPMERILTTC